MIKVTLYNDYVSQQDDVKNLFLDTTRNLYIKKGSTGIGGTSVILESSDVMRVVVSPTIGMIQGKEKQNLIKNPNCFFIYGNSINTWEDFFNCPSIGKVVNCTPDQITNLRKNRRGLYKLLINSSIFVDEIHQFIPDSSFRGSMLEFLDIIFKEWKGNWILSTATDNRIGGILIDVPPNQVFEEYEITKVNPPQIPVEVKRVNNNNISIYKDIIDQSILNGRKLLVATNNSDIHKRLSKLVGYRVVNLVGQNIETKMRAYKDIEKVEEIDWNSVDVVVISSRYFAGFDIPLFVDVCIDTNPHIKTSMIGVNDIRQIIGRARGGVGRVVLIISFTEANSDKVRFISSIPSGPNDVIKNLTDSISNIKSDWFKSIQNIINEFTHYQLLYAPVLKRELLRYNMYEVRYKDIEVKSLLKINSWTFKDQVNKLVNGTELSTVYFDFIRICTYLKYKNDGIFPPKMSILFYACYLIKRHKIDIDISKNIKPSRFYSVLDSKIENDWRWDLLYAHHKTELNRKKSKPTWVKDRYTKEQLEYLEIRSLPSVSIVEETQSGIDCFFKSMDELKKKGIVPDQYETDKLESRCMEVKSYKSVKDWKGLRTRDQLLKTVGWANLYLLNGGKESYDFPLRRDRTYNPLTQIPGPLRSMIGTDIIEIDINSANPTFIDDIVGSSIHKVVYDNIMRSFNIDRTKAKIMYNTYLNNHIAKPMEVYKFFTRAGYTNDQSIKLAELVTSRKGSVYDEMTKRERQTIEFIAEHHLPNCRWFRFHDAILLIEKDNIGILNGMPKEVNGIELNIKYYNK